MTGKITAPASAARLMFRKWILLKGVSRTQRMSGRPLLKAYVGSALDQIRGQPMGDSCQSAHAARQDNHAIRWIAAAGRTGGDVVFGELLHLGGGLA